MGMSPQTLSEKIERAVCTESPSGVMSAVFFEGGHLSPDRHTRSCRRVSIFQTPGEILDENFENDESGCLSFLGL
jgi:hypothetical protein